MPLAERLRTRIGAVKAADYATLGDVVRTQAAQRPNAVAIVCQRQAMTYAALDRASSAVAAGLIAAGVKPSDRVAILARNSGRFLECLFGASKAGAVLTPINWRLAPAEIEYILGDCGASVLFADADLLARLPSKDCGKVTTRIVLDGELSGELGYDDWLGAGATVDPQVPVSPDDIAVQMYTSGTTGRPKGAMLSHAAFEKLCDLDGPPTLPWFRMSETDTAMLVVPMFHIGGTDVALRPLFSGGKLIIHRDFDPAAVLRDIAACRVSVISLVPTVLQMLIEHPHAATTDFSSLRTVSYGSSPIPLDLLRNGLRVLRCDFVQVYGLTETGGAATSLSPGDHTLEDSARMRSAGTALPGYEVRVIDAQGKPLPSPHIGEIAVRSRSVMQGYWGLSEATAAAIDGEGWFRSGDLGYFDEDGYLYIHDRVKDMIVSGAENIYPAEVENAIFSHPQVQEVAVIGVPDAKWGEAVKAVIVARPGETIDAAELIAWVRTRIAGYKVPRSIDMCDALPRNASGKVLKTELRKPYWAHHTRAVN